MPEVESLKNHCHQRQPTKYPLTNHRAGALSRVSGLKHLKHMNPSTDVGSLQVTRRLKIEAAGDFWKGLLKPKIRLMGRWLDRAGFKSGHHVYVRCISPGVIELRSADSLPTNDIPNHKP